MVIDGPTAPSEYQPAKSSSLAQVNDLNIINEILEIVSNKIKNALELSKTNKTEKLTTREKLTTQIGHTN